MPNSTDCYKTDVAAQFPNNKDTGLLHAYDLVGGADIATLAIGVRAFTDKDATAEATDENGHYAKGDWYEQDWTKLDHQDIRKKESTVISAIAHLEASIIYPPEIPSLDVDWLDQGINTRDSQRISLAVNKASPDDEVKIQCQGNGCNEFGWTQQTEFLDTQIADSQVVQYRIKARNAVAESEWSPWYSVTIGDRTPPSPFPLTIKLISAGLNSGNTQSVEVETDEATSPWELVEYKTYVGEPVHQRGPSTSDVYRTPADVHDNQTYGISGRMVDLNGNFSSWVNVSVRIPDYTSPTVTSVTGDITTCGASQTIAASLADNVGVTSASLYYTPIGGVETSLDFTTGSADNPIAANSYGDIPYYITARDIRGNSVRSPQSGSYTITVVDPSLDSDGDTIGDCDDGCPFDSNRVSPGYGGCGASCFDLIRNGSTLEGFPSLQEAIYDSSAVDFDTLQITTADLNEDVVFDRDIILTLSGGYFCDFHDHPATSSINSLIIRDGTAIVENVVIQSPPAPVVTYSFSGQVTAVYPEAPDFPAEYLSVAVGDIISGEVSLTGTGVENPGGIWEKAPRIFSSMPVPGLTEALAPSPLASVTIICRCPTGTMIRIPSLRKPSACRQPTNTMAIWCLVNIGIRFEGPRHLPGKLLFASSRF